MTLYLLYVSSILNDMEVSCGLPDLFFDFRKFNFYISAPSEDTYVRGTHAGRCN
jgi:hypothetical protein